MIDRATAQRIAEATIASMSYDVAGDRLVLVEEATIEKSYGWVFFYDSRKYLEAGDTSVQLAGNAPLLVHRHDGSIDLLGTARPIEEYLAAYEKTVPIDKRSR